MNKESRFSYSGVSSKTASPNKSVANGKRPSLKSIDGADTACSRRNSDSLTRTEGGEFSLPQTSFHHNCLYCFHTGSCSALPSRERGFTGSCRARASFCAGSPHKTRGNSWWLEDEVQRERRGCISRVRSAQSVIAATQYQLTCSFPNISLQLSKASFAGTPPFL